MKHGIAACSAFLFIFFAFICPARGEEASPRVVHVLVALCDNEAQGIVPVPPALGNGQNPEANLYWGAKYGVKTFFRKQREWVLLEDVKDPAPGILERLVFRHASTNVFLVADAYDGAKIKETTSDFLLYASGGGKHSITAKGASVPVGGNAALVVYIGHNGLMDFSLAEFPQAADAVTRDAAAFACMTDRYFAEPLRQAGAKPLLLTTNFMCPEAYSLHALLASWMRGDTAAKLRESVAQAYSTYQKCGIGGSRRLFVTN